VNAFEFPNGEDVGGGGREGEGEVGRGMEISLASQICTDAAVIALCLVQTRI